MSGFAGRLVVRARGGDGATVARPRRAPRFVPATGGGPAESMLLTAIGAEAPAGPEAAPAPRPAGAVVAGDERPSERRDARPPAAPVPAVSRGRDVPVPQLDRRPIVPRERGAPSHAVAPPAVAKAPARPAVPAPAAAARAPRQQSANTAAALVRAIPRPPALLPATSAAAAPRVEVHIGRVEVAAPPATPAPTRTLGSPAAQRPATPRPAAATFAELAAARRHIDRIAR